MFYIIPACIRSAKPLHAFGNIGLIGFEEQMIMVIHENIGINLNPNQGVTPLLSHFSLNYKSWSLLLNAKGSPISKIHGMPDILNNLLYYEGS